MGLKVSYGETDEKRCRRTEDRQPDDQDEVPVHRRFSWEAAESQRRLVRAMWRMAQAESDVDAIVAAGGGDRGPSDMPFKSKEGGR